MLEMVSRSWYTVSKTREVTRASRSTKKICRGTGSIPVRRIGWRDGRIQQPVHLDRVRALVGEQRKRDAPPARELRQHRHGVVADRDQAKPRCAGCPLRRPCSSTSCVLQYQVTVGGAEEDEDRSFRLYQRLERARLPVLIRQREGRDLRADLRSDRSRIESRRLRSPDRCRESEQHAKEFHRTGQCIWRRGSATLSASSRRRRGTRR